MLDSRKMRKDDHYYSFTVTVQLSIRLVLLGHNLLPNLMDPTHEMSILLLNSKTRKTRAETGLSSKLVCLSSSVLAQSQLPFLSFSINRRSQQQCLFNFGLEIH